MNRILVVAVHPDDETLGCGGTLLRHQAEGADIFWCIVTAPRREEGFSQTLIDARERQVRRVREFYGFNRAYCLNFPAAALDQVPRLQLVQALEQVLKTCRPDTLYLPFHADIHSDHQIAFQAAFSCTKSFRFPFLENIYMMETPSETEFATPLTDSWFVPNHFVDISSFLDRKIEIMREYGGEMADHPFPRSAENIRALAILRGAMAGCRFAEAFMVIRELRR